MRMQRRPLVVGMAILFALVLAGCGDDDHNNTRWIYSRPLGGRRHHPRPRHGSPVRSVFRLRHRANVLAGITFVLPSGQSTADTRGFLQFPLSNIPVGADRHLRQHTIFLDAVTLSETVAFQPVLRRPDRYGALSRADRFLRLLVGVRWRPASFNFIERGPGEFRGDRGHVPDAGGAGPDASVVPGADRCFDNDSVSNRTSSKTRGARRPDAR